MNTLDKSSQPCSPQTEAVFALLVDRGFIDEHTAAVKKSRSSHHETEKKAYHNTELLLKNYRNIVWQMECEVDQIAAELNLPFRNLDAILSRIDAEIGMENKYLERKLDQLAKLRQLINRVNDALTLLKKKPDNGEKLYNLIYLTFISEEKLRQNDVLYRLDISRRHFYRLREQAIQVLSLRLWSAPTSELEMWLELVSIMNKEV